MDHLQRLFPVRVIETDHDELRTIAKSNRVAKREGSIVWMPAVPPVGMRLTVSKRDYEVLGVHFLGRKLPGGQVMTEILVLVSQWVGYAEPNIERAAPPKTKPVPDRAG